MSSHGVLCTAFIGLVSQNCLAEYVDKGEVDVQIFSME